MISNNYRYALWPTSQFYFCGIPLRLDSRPKCAINCPYCFAMLRGGRRSSYCGIASVVSIERKIRNALISPRKNNVLDQMLNRRLPLHFGGISDPFADEETCKVSLGILKVLGEYDYPIVISTKNPIRLLKPDIINILSHLNKIVIQISIPGMNPEQALICEPCAPLPEARISALEHLAKEGLLCQCRLQPLLWFSALYSSNEIIPRLSQAGCRHVIVEHLKLPVEKHTFGDDFSRMLTSLSWDGYKEYKRLGAICVGREWQLPVSFKWTNLEPIRDRIRSCGMTFGAGDYGLNHLSDTQCCCGVDQYVGYYNCFRGNIPSLIRMARIGRMQYPGDDFVDFFPGSIRDVLNSKCRIFGSDHTIRTYIKAKWNRPGTVNAPDQYLGVSWLNEKDQDGMCVYLKEDVL